MTAIEMATLNLDEDHYTTATHLETQTSSWPTFGELRSGEEPGNHVLNWGRSDDRSLTK